ncbi:TPA: hypothetical protein ACIVT4_002068, partial [Salmonella enterica subsp. diarizonae serovar 61:l,v:z35]
TDPDRRVVVQLCGALIKAILRRLTYTRLDKELEKIAHYPDSLIHSCVPAHRLSLITGMKTN